MRSGFPPCLLAQRAVGPSGASGGSVPQALAGRPLLPGRCFCGSLFAGSPRLQSLCPSAPWRRVPPARGHRRLCSSSDDPRGPCRSVWRGRVGSDPPDDRCVSRALPAAPPGWPHRLCPVRGPFPRCPPQSGCGHAHGGALAASQRRGSRLGDLPQERAEFRPFPRRPGLPQRGRARMRRGGGRLPAPLGVRLSRAPRAPGRPGPRSWGTGPWLPASSSPAPNLRAGSSPVAPRSLPATLRQPHSAALSSRLDHGHGLLKKKSKRSLKFLMQNQLVREPPGRVRVRPPSRACRRPPAQLCPPAAQRAGPVSSLSVRTLVRHEGPSFTPASKPRAGGRAWERGSGGRQRQARRRLTQP